MPLPAPTAAGEWTGRDVTVAEIERELASLRIRSLGLRTSVMTHLAWVPEDWRDAARKTLAGLAERHPSRTIMLLPEPNEPAGLDAAISLACFALPGLERNVCSEVIELHLRGDRVRAPASIVLPLLLPDLPVFMRWRGRPPFGTPGFEGLVDVVDRLVIDSGEWPDVPAAYAELETLVERTAISDLAWARTLPRRRRLARDWPDVPERIEAPAAEAWLLAGWLRARLGAQVEPVVVPGPPEGLQSDLLARELDRFARDPVYEAAVLGTLSGDDDRAGSGG
jgi:glucose-6-phosphate dehydrogenase assembly protein OpcA